MMLRVFLFTVLLAGAGLWASVRLAERHLLLRQDPSLARVGRCGWGGELICDATLLGPFGSFAGIPTAVIGAAAYAALLTVVAAGVIGAETFNRPALWLLRAAAIVAAMVSVVLMVVMVGGEGRLCPLCVLVHIVNFLQVLNVSLPVKTAAVPGPAMPRRFAIRIGVIVGLGAAAVAAAVILGFQAHYQKTLHLSARRLLENKRYLLALYRGLPRTTMILTGREPHEGPEHAEHLLILWVDLRCPACADAKRIIDRAMRRFAGRMKLVLKYLPPAARRGMRFARSGDSYRMACLMQAVWDNRPDLFWLLLDEVYRRPTVTDFEGLVDLTARLGAADVKKLVQLADSAPVRAQVETDIAQGLRAGVTSTPAVLLDGRNVSDYISDELFEAVLEARP